VAQRNPKPVDQIIHFCEKQEVSVSFNTDDTYRLYRDPELTDLVDESTSFQISGLSGDTSFYATNTSGPLESLPAIISMIQTDFPSEISISHDLDDLTSNLSLIIDAAVNPSTKVNWVIGGVPYSGRAVRYRWDGEPELDILMNATDTSSGCSNQVAQFITGDISSPPIIQDTIVCSNLQLSLIPDGDGPFFFYADATKSQILSKGNGLNINGLIRDTVFYLSSASHLVESAVVPWNVVVEVFEDTIETSPEMVILSENRSLTLYAASDLGISWQWYVGDAFFESIRSPTLLFDSVGSYNIRLESVNNSGCKSIEEITYQVTNVTALSSEHSGISIYPNPALHTIHFKSDQQVVSIEVINTAGAILLNKKIGQGEFQMNVSAWSAGMYHIILRLTNGEVYLHRVVK
jgi:hypothetical protein